MTPDMKVIAWLMQGSVEVNKISRDIDLKILRDAIDSDFREIYDVILKYFFRYKSPPTYDILKDILPNIDLDQIQLLSYLEENGCKEAEVLYHLDSIRDRYNEQLAGQLAESILSQNKINLSNFNSSLLTIAAKIERLKKSAVFAEGDFTKSISERLNDYKFICENPDAASGTMSGYPELDDYTFGIKNSELMVISGASSSGKSLLMMNMAINAWLGSNVPFDLRNDFQDNGKNVVYFTLEMSKKQLEQRMDANVADVRHRALMRGLLTEEEQERWNNSLDFQREYKKHFYIVDIPRGSRVLDIEARYNSILAEFQPDLVCVDYLGIMKPNYNLGQDWLDVGHVAADLHEFCRSKNTAVITAAQRKARNKNAKNSSNDVEELGRSKMIGDNSNIVLLIEQRDNEHLRDDMVLHLVKNRDGAKGEFKLRKEFEKSKISSFDEDWITNFGKENDVE